MNKEELPKEFIDRIERFNKLFIEGTKNSNNPRSFEEDPLFYYEMLNIEEALKLVKIFKDKDNLKNITRECMKVKGEKYKLIEFIDFLEENYNLQPDKRMLYFLKIGTYIPYNLAICYILFPSLVPYMHGSLSFLVGDERYYDDRLDASTKFAEYKKLINN